MPHAMRQRGTEDRGRPPRGLTRETLLAILERARWAPSGDNCQPCRVRTDPTGELLEVGVRAEEIARPAFLDVHHEASRIAAGAFVENVRLAAGERGLGCEAEFVTEETAWPWARLRFSASDASPDPLARFLEARVSNRKLYEEESCSPAELASLGEAVASVPGVRLDLLTDRRHREMIGLAVAITDKIRMRHPRCHVEFHEKTRWTEEESQRDPTGFFVKTFEVRPHEVLALRATRNYRVMRALDAVTRMSSMAAALARKQVLRSGAIGMLSVDERTPASLLRAGVGLQRAWLAATGLGLGFQVLAVASMFIRRCELGGEGFSRWDCERVAKARAYLELGGEVPPPERQVILFRVGKSGPPTARTGRLPAETFFDPG